MIELSDIIGFIGFTIVLVLAEYVFYGKKRAIKTLPIAIFFSAIINLVWVGLT